MIENNNETIMANNDISVTISSIYRNPCQLDWAESSWKRWIYVAFWCWLNPILNIGSKRKLTVDDLFDLSPNDECGRLLKKVERVWQKYENNCEHINIVSI